MLIGFTDTAGGFEIPSLYGIGDVVYHKTYCYLGVITSQDASCQAGDNWYYANKTQPARNQPWYYLLVHQSGGLSTYVAQSNLLAAPKESIIEHPRLGNYFCDFKEGRYLPHPADSGNCSI